MCLPDHHPRLLFTNVITYEEGDETWVAWFSRRCCNSDKGFGKIFFLSKMCEVFICVLWWNLRILIILLETLVRASAIFLYRDAYWTRISRQMTPSFWWVYRFLIAARYWSRIQEHQERQERSLSLFPFPSRRFFVRFVYSCVRLLHSSDGL